MPNLFEANDSLTSAVEEGARCSELRHDHNQFRAYESHYVTVLVPIYDQVAVNPVGG